MSAAHPRHPDRAPAVRPAIANLGINYFIAKDYSDFIRNLMAKSKRNLIVPPTFKR